MAPEKARPVPDVNAAVPPLTVMSLVMVKLGALLRLRVPPFTLIVPVPKLQLVAPVPIWRVPVLTVMPPDHALLVAVRVQVPAPSLVKPPIPRVTRSEEHTSELQSLRHLVCRL